ncbi:hypothetical protein KOW79_000248 [Hemibagrus wyckioides]|uniref:Serine protease n=1 Tax=Hemibagrus wyckioides TaxID=337641 RepID=A0A9D3SUL0_9TELE|nr:hypothetical protein KOW79_000248 [Hemibagrus wyckioides]
MVSTYFYRTLQKIFKQNSNESAYLDAQPNNRSDPPWLKKDIIEKYTDQLESTNGPVVYKNGEVLEYKANMELLIQHKIPCVIITKFDALKFVNFIPNGLGCYYGYGYVLTALHVVKPPRFGKSKILIAFPTEDFILVYKADFNQSCNTDADRDLAFVKLRGNTHPLGDGLHNQIANMNVNDNIYFHTRALNGNFQKQEGEVYKKMTKPDMFAISVAGKPGDSGSPIFNSKHELVAIYRGGFQNSEFGHCSKIPQNFTPWVQSLRLSSYFLHKWQLFLCFLSKIGDEPL